MKPEDATSDQEVFQELGTPARAMNLYPRHQRRSTVLLPRPGLPSTKTLGLLISFALVNQLMGSQHRDAPVRRCLPMGTPTIGAPAPRLNGHRPQVCRVLPLHSCGCWISVLRPPPGP